jgi:hypothetical protein
MSPLIEPIKLAPLVRALALRYGSAFFGSRLFVSNLSQPEIHMQGFPDHRRAAPLAPFGLFFHHRSDFRRQ